jgi:5-deoxy-glucuronate isomerase
MSRIAIRHRNAPGPNGLLVSITPESAGWSYVGFEVYRLLQGMRVERAPAGQEVCVVMLSGQADITFRDHEWRDVGSRKSVFDGPPEAVYAPPGAPIVVTASRDTCEIALCWAPADRGVEPALLPAAAVKPFQRGSGPTQRTIHDILMLDKPAERLLVTEVLTPGGGWSSFPPRKHDTDDLPRESPLEEIYYHRMASPRGFAMQAVYTDDRSLDEAFQVRDGDAAPGYDLYYLNVMAGPSRRWLATTDPDHRPPA